MFSGFDFGTSNCAMGVMNGGEGEQSVELLPINQGEVFMPSVLYSLHRNLICESAALQMTDKTAQQAFMDLRSAQLGQARSIRMQEDILPGEQAVFVGQEAFDQYLSYPGEGYFVKSVKSFLGCSGLQPQAVQFFEDIVTSMMLNIKQRAEQSLGKSITHTVIGRPVNFQGVYPEKSNQRAIEILTLSAQRSGFQSIEFLYEPLAAGLHFEQTLSEDKTVLIVDVGGGTTDCSMVRMGPGYRDKTERADDILGHTGDRVGGNDFDIQIAGGIFMPLFGMNSHFKDGTFIPNQIFWKAVRTNNIGDQTVFNSKESGFKLQQYVIESAEPQLLKRFIKLRDEKMNHQLVRTAEQSKITLSEKPQLDADLAYIEDALHCPINREQFAHVVKRPIATIVRLIDEVIEQAGSQPDVVYITGGAAKSQVIREAIEQQLQDIETVDGDHFGSVAKGLTVWAQRLFA